MEDVELGPEDAYVVEPALGMAALAKAYLTEPDWRDPLVRRRTLPPRGFSSYVAMRDGWPVRSLRLPRRDDGPGTILMITGRADFVEKYTETLHDLTEAGWGVAIFDWRGQGLSRRVGKTPQHGASPGFGVWLDDLQEMLAWAATDGPVNVMAHSMGGHLLLRHLAGGGAHVARAVVLAPMVGLAGAPLGPFPTRVLTSLQMLRGAGSDYVLGGGPWRAGVAGDRRQTMLTSDPDRYRDESWWIGQYPSLALGSVTWGWLDDAFTSIAALQARGMPEAISTPLLALVPGKDALVDSAATQRLIKRVPGGLFANYPGAGHELLREAEPLRSQVLARAVAFLTTGQ
ncbi:alpha/beta hydrolase [Sandarakinorhabdus sp.]|uniref:alpha/beta hydrolase n=1 Tax=Sandarakinorhabdus sp. TaxID=1916663 RepID=UPI003F72DA8B